MQLFITKQIGKKKHTFVVEGENLFELQMEAQKLSFQDIYKCGCCGSDNLYLRAYLTKEGYKYVKIVCWDCKSDLTFGSVQKSPNTFYLRKREDGKFDWLQGVKEDKQETKKEKPKTEDNIGGEDLPF